MHKNTLFHGNGLRKFKFNIFKILLSSINQTETQTNLTKNIYVSNVPLLNLSNFKINKYNQNIIKMFQTVNKSENCLSRSNYIETQAQPQNMLNNLKYTNYTPLNFFVGYKTNNDLKINDSKRLNGYTSISRKFNTEAYKSFLMFYVISFLEKYVKKKFWIRIDVKNPFNAFWNNYIKIFCQKYSYLYRRFNKLLVVQEMLEILIVTMQKQDLQILLVYIKKKFESTHFKRHKKILSIFFDILKKNKIILNLTNTKGFSFDIRGKVGVSGNAKKRHIFFSIGKISTTSQNLKSQWQQISVWTPTGQMGITCLLQS